MGNKWGEGASCKIRRRRIIREEEGGNLKSYVPSYLDCSETVFPQKLTGV
jgi:hypothetical protein